MRELDKFIEAGKPYRFSSKNQPKRQNRSGGQSMLTSIIKQINESDGFSYFKDAEVLDENNVPTGKLANIRLKVGTKDQIALSLIQAMEKQPKIALAFMKEENRMASRSKIQKQEEPMTGDLEMALEPEDQKKLVELLNKTIIVRD